MLSSFLLLHPSVKLVATHKNTQDKNKQILERITKDYCHVYEIIGAIKKDCSCMCVESEVEILVCKIKNAYYDHMPKMSFFVWSTSQHCFKCNDGQTF